MTRIIDLSARSVELTRWTNGVSGVHTDAVAVEEPLEIRVAERSLAVVMRTPGQDRELVAGFLVTEGILRDRSHLLDLVNCRERNEPEANIMNVLLAPGAEIDWARLQRHTFASSSCGLCGKVSIDAVRVSCAPIAPGFVPAKRVIERLPALLGQSQIGFAVTGGLHASGLFSSKGELLAVREDVGRHNALDKLVGWGFMGDALPFSERILLVSGRVSFELMQKALAAGIPCVAAVSAPTSLAVEFARESGQTLVGFVRGERMNVYAGTLLE